MYCNLRTRQYDVPEEDLFSPSFLPAASIQNQFGWFVVALNGGGGEVGRLHGRGGGGGGQAIGREIHSMSYLFYSED